MVLRIVTRGVRCVFVRRANVFRALALFGAIALPATSANAAVTVDQVVSAQTEVERSPLRPSPLVPQTSSSSRSRRRMALRRVAKRSPSAAPDSRGVSFDAPTRRRARLKSGWRPRLPSWRT